MASVIFTDMSYLAKFVPLSWVPKESSGGGGSGRGGWIEVLWRPETFAVDQGGKRFFIVRVQYKC